MVSRATAKNVAAARVMAVGWVGGKPGSETSGGQGPEVTQGPSRQGREEGPGLLEVGRGKPFGEPPIGLAEEVASRVTLTLTLPEPTQAHGGSQFQRFGLLLAGQSQGLMKLLFRS